MTRLFVLGSRLSGGPTARLWGAMRKFVQGVVEIRSLKFRGQKTEIRGRKAWSGGGREQRAKTREQRAKSRERRAGSLERVAIYPIAISITSTSNSMNRSAVNF